MGLAKAHQYSRLPIHRFASHRFFIAWLAFISALVLLVGSIFELSHEFAAFAITPPPTETPAPAKIARYVPPPTSTSTDTPTSSSTPTRKPTATTTKSATATRTPSHTPTLASSPTLPALRSQASVRTITATLVAAPTQTATPLPGMGWSYSTLSVLSDHVPVHPADVNLAVRGFVPISATHALVDYAGEADAAAPQLASLFMDSRTPSIVATYQLYDWSPGCDCRATLIADYEVTLVGLAATPGEMIRVPDSGYDIGGGFEALVAYADADRLVLTYTRSDGVIRGYALYLDSVAVDGDLVRLYDQLSGAGRGELPALRPGQPFGKAKGTEVKVAIRDSGAFLDPRSRKDWWRGH